MPFKGDVSFQDVRIPPGSKTDPVVQVLIKELNRTHAKLNSLITSLERTSSGSATVVVLGGSSSSGSGGSTGSGSGLPAGSVNVTAGVSTRVDFSTAFGSISKYVLQITTYSSTQKGQVAYEFTRDASGFDITAFDDCTVSWSTHAVL